MHDVIKKLRRSGQVRRCHTIPWVGRYTVAEHCYHMLALLEVLWPESRPRTSQDYVDLVRMIIVHDYAEYKTGDMPAPFKQEHPTLAAGIAELEQRIIFEELSISSYDLTSNPTVRSWLKGLDILEFAYACTDQLALGNTTVGPAFDRITEIIYSQLPNLPSEILECWQALRENQL